MPKNQDNKSRPKTKKSVSSYEKLSERLKNLEQTLAEKEQALQELRESEQKYKIQVENAHDIVFTFDRQGICSAVNGAIERILGLTPAEVQHKDIRNFVERESRPRFDDLFRRVANGGAASSQYCEAFFKTATDLLVCLEFSFSLIWKDGEPYEVLGIARDITAYKATEKALKENESRFRAFAEASFEGIIISAKGILLDANSRLAEIFGYSESEIEQLKGHSFMFGIIPEERDRVMTQALLDYSEPYEFRAVRKDGSIITVEVCGRSIEFQGRPCRIAAVRDITEQKASREKIERALEEKNTMVQEIHHRVKNNLQFIISLLNLQKKHIVGKDVIDVLEDTQKRLQTISRIHQKLHAYDDFTRINLSEYLKESVKDLYRCYNIDNKRITLDLQSNVECLDLSQTIMCSLLLNELFSNSFRHAFNVDHQGTIKIKIKQNRDGELTGLSYKDTGCGIDQAAAMGLGWQLINMLAEQLGFTVAVISSPGSGTSYTFKRGYHSLTPSSPLKLSGNDDIILVEDEIIIARERKMVIREWGFSVCDRIFFRGEDIVDYVDKLVKKPAIIIMDIKLRGKMDGLEAARLLAHRYPTIKFIFITGYGNKEIVTQILSIPGAIYLDKMCSNDSLKGMLEEVLSRQGRLGT